MAGKIAKNWKIIREINVGAFRRGFVVKNDEAELRLIVTIDSPDCFGKNVLFNALEQLCGKHRYGSNDSEIQQQELLRLKGLEDFVGLQHANVAAVYDVSLGDNDQPAVEMEYVAGERITAALYGAPLDVYLAHFKQVFEGLAFIHKLGRLHLSLRPNHILTDSVNGITKIINVWQTHTEDDVKNHCFQISPVYVAPEIVLHGTADERSDLFSVGVMMYEAWCQLLPYQRMGGESIEALSYNIKNEKDVERVVHPVQFTVDEPVQTPKDLENFILKLLKRNPQDREFKNAREVVNFMLDTWPAIAKPPSELFGRVMTTIRL